MTHHVYTMHDAEGRCVYVGRSSRPRRSQDIFCKLTGITTDMQTVPFEDPAEASAYVIKLRAELKPSYNESLITTVRNEARANVVIGDSRETMKRWPDQTFQVCVTSPPYFGLRDYQTGEWHGGDPNHKHDRRPAPHPDGGGPKQTPGASPKSLAAKVCSCGAVYVDPQIGLEDSIDEYVMALVELFREVRRVLRDDGTLWVNLGDTYASSGNGEPSPAETLAGGVAGQGEGSTRRSRPDGYNVIHDAKALGVKPKNLMGIPWRVAFALQADGWNLRQDVIWSKPNPMPESITDRCTKAHEYVFMFSKSERYYFDQEAIQEPSVTSAGRRMVGSVDQAAAKEIYKKPSERGIDMRTRPQGMREADGFRNKRSVWTVASAPYAGSHYATFPPLLIEPCILAGSKPGDFIMDPFGGTGTTAGVALRHGRNCVLFELSPTYAADIPHRVANVIEEATISKPTPPGFFPV